MSIEITRSIAAPPERVFRALTDGDELSRWWTTSADSDVRTGGAFSYVFEFADPSRDQTYAGTYDEVTPNERLRYPWATGNTTVEVTLRPSGDGTELTLTHEGFTDEELRRPHEEGWSFFLDNLKSWLETGTDLRPSAPMGQKTPARA